MVATVAYGHEIHQNISIQTGNNYAKDQAHQASTLDRKRCHHIQKDHNDHDDDNGDKSMSVRVPHQTEAEIFQPPTSSSISPLCIMTLLGVAAPPQEATLTSHRPEDSPLTSKFITPGHHKGPTVYTT
jgi:hypothetical protein